VIQNIKAYSVDNHVAHAYENVCRSTLREYARQGKPQFDKLGKWWGVADPIPPKIFDKTPQMLYYLYIAAMSGDGLAICRRVNVQVY
jgi:hypothetical protein